MKSTGNWTKLDQVFPPGTRCTSAPNVQSLLRLREEIQPDIGTLSTSTHSIAQCFLPLTLERSNQTISANKQNHDSLANFSTCYFTKGLPSQAKEDVTPCSDLGPHLPINLLKCHAQIIAQRCHKEVPLDTSICCTSLEVNETTD